MNIKITPDNTIPVKLNQVTKTGSLGIQHVLRNGVLLPEVGGDVDISVPEKLSELKNDLNLTELLQIDNALSATSKNPVQNKVITAKYTELNTKVKTLDDIDKILRGLSKTLVFTDTDMILPEEFMRVAKVTLPFVDASDGIQRDAELAVYIFKYPPDELPEPI